MSVLAKLAIVLVTVAVMEAVAYAVHRWWMHGPGGWAWHESHHRPRTGWFEKNDLYGAIFALIAMGLFIAGALWSPTLWWVAVGITAYGAIYATVHDGLVHQRFMRWVPRRGYARRLVQAHKLHHATQGRDGAVSFGFVWARDPAEYKAELARNVKAGRARLRPADVTDRGLA